MGTDWALGALDRVPTHRSRPIPSLLSAPVGQSRRRRRQGHQRPLWQRVDHVPQLGPGEDVRGEGREERGPGFRADAAADATTPPLSSRETISTGALTLDGALGGGLMAALLIPGARLWRSAGAPGCVPLPAGAAAAWAELGWEAAATSASRRVGSLRESRIARRCASVNRPAMDSPAR